MACGQRRQVCAVFHEFSYLYLIKGSRIGLVLCRIGLSAKTGFMNKTGFLGSHLQFGNG